VLARLRLEPSRNRPKARPGELELPLQILPRQTRLARTEVGRIARHFGASPRPSRIREVDDRGRAVVLPPVGRKLLLGKWGGEDRGSALLPEGIAGRGSLDASPSRRPLADLPVRVGVPARRLLLGLHPRPEASGSIHAVAEFLAREKSLRGRREVDDRILERAVAEAPAVGDIDPSSVVRILESVAARVVLERSQFLEFFLEPEQALLIGRRTLGTRTEKRKALVPPD
jgi:hypothetical protein